MDRTPLIHLKRALPLVIVALTVSLNPAVADPSVSPRPFAPAPLPELPPDDDEPPAARAAEVEIVSAPLPGLTPAPPTLGPDETPLLEWRWTPGEVHRYRRQVESALVLDGRYQAIGTRVRETQIVVDAVDAEHARLIFTITATRSKVIAGGQAVVVDSGEAGPVPAAATLGTVWDLALVGTPLELTVDLNGVVQRVDVPDDFAYAEARVQSIRRDQGHPGDLTALRVRLAPLQRHLEAPGNWRLDVPALPGGWAVPGRRWQTNHTRQSALMGRVAQVLDHVVESVTPEAVVIAFTDHGVVDPRDDAEHVERFRNPGRLTFDPVQGVVTAVRVQLDSASRTFAPDGRSQQRHVWMTIEQTRLDDSDEQL